jgi:DNA polymerase-3 subunit gamma/tau
MPVPEVISEAPSPKGPVSKAPSKQEPIPEGPPPSAGQEKSASPPQKTAHSAPGNDKKRIRLQWDAFLKYVHERQPWLTAALQLATSMERKDNELIVHFDDSADCTMLKQRNYINSLTEFVLDFFQENLSIRFEVPGSNACAIDPANGLAPQQERRALANDPLVLTALDVFTGQVGDIRVGPRYRTSTNNSVENTAAEEQPAAEE